jgi:hypothetical protein
VGRRCGGGGEGVLLGEGHQGMPPPSQHGVPRVRSPRTSPRETGSGMIGGVPVFHRSAQAPQGIHSLGEALIAICTVTSFPPAQGMPMYEAWEARIKELTAYVQHHTNTAHSRLHSVAQGTGAMTVLRGCSRRHCAPESGRAGGGSWACAALGRGARSGSRHPSKGGRGPLRARLGWIDVLSAPL